MFRALFWSAVLMIIYLLIADICFGNDYRAKAAIAIAMAKQTPCNCYETGVCTCDVCECEWCDYLEFVAKAKANKSPIVVFVGGHKEDVFDSLTDCYRICLTRFPGVEKGIVVGKWNGTDHTRIDMPETASATQIKLAAGIIQLPTYQPPAQVPYYSSVRQPAFAQAFAPSFSFGGGGC